MLSKRLNTPLRHSCIYLGRKRGLSSLLKLPKKNIPIKFLENILLELKNMGYSTARKVKAEDIFKERPKNITLASVMRKLDDRLLCYHASVSIFMNPAKIVMKAIVN